ncbi:DUF6301 family protein [Nocardia yamanashiensis]|uniref:DUF6301 family protein n=1 Tax=Nocardia yamanashiensis TaxID=209247 RepID=UPI0012FD2184|nr:DUF6301 family protein [Nocardia yamanashiensis]
MGFAVYVDMAGAVEIVRAARDFKWSWGPDNVRDFARRAGWGKPEPVGTMRRGPVFARTGLGVWFDSAMFWGSGYGLRYVRVTVSDAPAPDAFARAEHLSAAFAQLRDKFTRLYGEPEPGAGPDDGVSWNFSNLIVGLTDAAGTVDLLLVNPIEQRYWMERRHDAVRRRAALGGWGRVAEDLAAFLERLPVDARVVLTAPGGRYVQFAVDETVWHAELSRSEFVDPTWRYGAEVERVLRAHGWSDAPDANWWRTLPRGSGTAAVSNFALRSVEALRSLGVAAATDLVADAWVEGGADIDIAPLGVPAHPTSRSQRAEFLRQHAISVFDAGPLRVDIPAGVEIARAARDFDWTWTRADVDRFAELTGWRWEGVVRGLTGPGVREQRGTAAAVSAWPRDRIVRAVTEVRVDGARARFCFDGDRLEAVCVSISDSIESALYEDGLPVEVREQLTAAHTRATEGLREEFGMPVHGTLWQAHGPVWANARLTLGLVAGPDTVELYIVNPAERARRLIPEQQHTARRAGNREWRQFFDELACLAGDLAPGGHLTVDTDLDGGARIDRDVEGVRVRLDAVAGKELPPRVTELMTANGWSRPDSGNPHWRHGMRLPVLFRDFRYYVEFALWPLCTRMRPGTVLRVWLDGADQGLRTPSTGSTSNV